jgi:orotidine-5'-phosphate decarboxylase
MMIMQATKQILERMKSHNTLLCCGLDPDLEKLPIEIMESGLKDEDKVLSFLKTVVDITAEHVCAYKVQKAFFDSLSGGHETLRELIEYIHRCHIGLPVIVDCKIGDIDNTMKAYTHNLFNLLLADGVVVNPYMGDDVLLPLTQLPNKAVVVLVKTSNPAGGIIQDVKLDGGKILWEYILDLVVNRWNTNENMIPVISATAGLDMKRIRSIIPDQMPILLAGIGAQGGDYGHLNALLNSENIGVFVNSSRGILYPKCHKPWRIGIEDAVIELKNTLNNERKRV